MTGFMHYLTQVPSIINIAGLDAGRWALIMPAYGDAAARALPITTEQAAWMYQVGFTIAPAWDAEVREDLATVAGSDKNLRRLATALAEAQRAEVAA